ncbi:VOC family protein [Pollutibacter soli]|uniref:VOC family protein n=1 Tax=Pollutibacter soli TaxID=3034157 RepID=UPI003014047C
MAKLNPYLSFDKNCLEAMTFYKECFGGELTMQKVGEMPEMAAQMPPDFKDLIMHSTLVSGGVTIMASDLNREKPLEGNAVHLCLNAESEEELIRLFSKLGDGGKIIQPIGDMPWGGMYGELDDKFGKHWVFNWQKK